jgi:hypothetical protein
LSKELLVGILFTAGCLVPAWSQSRGNPDFALMALKLAMPGIFFAALAWFNCYAIARWESASAPLRLVRVWRVGCVLGATGVAAAILLFPAEPRVSALFATGAMSALLLAGLDWMRAGLSELTLRGAADLVLLTPLLLIACRFTGQ